MGARWLLPRERVYVSDDEQSIWNRPLPRRPHWARPGDRGRGGGRLLLGRGRPALNRRRARAGSLGGDHPVDRCGDAVGKCSPSWRVVIGEAHSGPASRLPADVPGPKSFGALKRRLPIVAPTSCAAWTRAVALSGPNTLTRQSPWPASSIR